ncbi:MAG: hypothetical protein EYC62_09305 [Alphaproteobacteria bacterium]|nr:MAG: hypothetical protein EYC62_09305 [Alphaproteobacteria bacterium]
MFRFAKTCGFLVALAACVLQAPPVLAQYECEFTPVGTPICLPPPVDDFERCPLCPNPGMLKLTDDNEQLAKGRALLEQVNHIVEQYQKLNEIMDDITSTLTGDHDTDDFRTDFYSQSIAAIADYHHEDRALIHINLSAQEMRDPRKVNSRVLQTYYSREHPDMETQLAIRKRRAEAYARSVGLMLAKAEAVKAIVQPSPDGEKSHTQRAIEAYEWEITHADTIGRLYGVVAAGLRLRMALHVVTADLLATRNQFLSLQQLQSAPIVAAPQAYMKDDAPIIDPYERYSAAQDEIANAGPDASPSHIYNPSPGSGDYLIRFEMVHNLNLNMGFRSSDGNGGMQELPNHGGVPDVHPGALLDATQLDQGRDGYCPQDPDHPGHADFTAAAMDRLQRLGNPSHCVYYSENGHSGAQPQETLFNTASSRAAVIAELHNTVIQIADMQQAALGFDDIMQCKAWSQTQADHFWGQVAATLGHSPFPDPNMAKASLLNRMISIDPFAYNLPEPTVESATQHASNLMSRFQRMSNAACRVSETLMASPRDILNLEPGGHNCTMQTWCRNYNGGWYRGNCENPRYVYCINNNYPSGTRMTLAPANVPNDRLEDASDPNYHKVIVGDQCRIQYSFRGAVANPPLGLMGKWFQSEKVADKWYEDACGVGRRSGRECGSNPDVFSAKINRDRVNEDIKKLNEKFWAMVQGLNDADDRLAFEQNPRGTDSGETAFLSPYVPSRDLSTSEGAANAAIAIADQISRLRQDVQQRLRNLDAAVAHVDATADGNANSEAYRTWRQRQLEQIEINRTQLNNLLAFANQVMDSNNRSCRLGFGVYVDSSADVTTVHDGVLKVNTEIPLGTAEAEYYENYRPLPPKCPTNIAREFLCLNKPFTSRPAVYFSPEIKDDFRE